MARRLALIIPLLFLLSACAVFPTRPLFGQAAAEVTPTLNPFLPTPDDSVFAPSWPLACRRGRFEAMRSDHPQGDLMAWSPDGVTLAYLMPGPGGWYTGELALAAAPAFRSREALAEEVNAAGDLSYSPQGNWLAFAALHPDGEGYTLMAYETATGGVNDLMPEAAGGAVGQTAVAGWSDERHVQAAYRCGGGCERLVELNVIDGSQRTIDDRAYKAVEAALVPAVLPESKPHDPETMPRAWRAAGEPYYWSPDGRRAVFVDPRGNAFLLDEDYDVLYRLEVGVEDALEALWSPDGRYVSVRSEAHVQVFEVGCTPATPTPEP